MNQKVSTGLGTAILLVMAFTAGYFVWMAEKNNQQEVPVTTVTAKQNSKSELTKQSEIKNEEKVIAEPNVTTNKEIATWKTYKNIKYGFEFKYPSDWPVPVLKEGKIYSNGSYPTEEDEGIFELGVGRKEKVCEGELCFQLTFEGYEGDNYDKFSSGLKEHVFAEIKSEKTVNGTKAIVFTEGGMCGYLSAFVFGKDKTIKFSALCGEDNPELSLKFNDILSTFRFSDSSKYEEGTTDPKWSIYSDESISFQYPKTLCGTSWQEEWDKYSCDEAWKVERIKSSTGGLIKILPSYSSYSFEFGGDIEISFVSATEFNEDMADKALEKGTPKGLYKMYLERGSKEYPDMLMNAYLSNGTQYVIVSNNFPDKYPRYFSFLIDSIVLK